MTTSAWTEDRIDRLKTLWREGKTADQVARDLGHGISRSAVLGKVHRLGLSNGRSRRSVQAPPAGVKAVKALPIRALDIPSVAPTPSPAAQSGLATLLSVRRFQCRWPMDAPGASDLSVCGRRVERGAFCGPHAQVAYRPARDNATALERLARLD